MASLLGFLFFVAVCAAIIAGRSRVISAPRRAATEHGGTWEPPKSDPLPYSRQKYFFSAAERSFYEVLWRITPDHTVFAKVRLADLVYVSKGATSSQSHFNRIRSKHVDFVICDRDLAPLVVVELDDSSHDRADRKSRDLFVDAVLAAASLPIVHVPAQRGYALDAIRQSLSPHLRVEPPPLPADASRYMPPLVRHASA